MEPGAVSHVMQDNEAGRAGPAAGPSEVDSPLQGRRRRSNGRTALVLLSIALVFFIGVIVNRFLYR